MLLGVISISLKNSEVIESRGTIFGNGAHAMIGKEYVGKKIKIIVGETKISKNKKIIKITLDNSEITERVVKNFGTGAHVIIPKEYAGKEIKIIVGVKR